MEKKQHFFAMDIKNNNNNNNNVCTTSHAGFKY